MSAKPVSALQNMNKGDLAKMNRELRELEEAAGDAGGAVAKFFKDKVKKRGINEGAYKLARKINSLDNAAKQQAFLRDFDKLRQMYGWDDQKNLFEADKTAPQKADEKPKKTGTAVAVLKPAKAAKAANGNGHAKPAGRPAKAAKAKAADLATGANARVNRRSERAAAAAVKPKGRTALFDEDPKGTDEARH